MVNRSKYVVVLLNSRHLITAVYWSIIKMEHRLYWTLTCTCLLMQQALLPSHDKIQRPETCSFLFSVPFVFMLMQSSFIYIYRKRVRDGGSTVSTMLLPTILQLQLWMIHILIILILLHIYLLRVPFKKIRKFFLLSHKHQIPQCKEG
jgi:hypothetical protein